VPQRWRTPPRACDPAAARRCHIPYSKAPHPILHLLLQAMHPIPHLLLPVRKAPHPIHRPSKAPITPPGKCTTSKYHTCLRATLCSGALSERGQYTFRHLPSPAPIHLPSQSPTSNAALGCLRAVRRVLRCSLATRASACRPRPCTSSGTTRSTRGMTVRGCRSIPRPHHDRS